MFDVSWTDPTRETVGERKTRKDQKANGLSRGSSMRSSRSSESSNPLGRPSLLNRFNGNKKDLTRTGSQPKLSAVRAEQANTSARRMATCTVRSESSVLESSSSTNTTRKPGSSFDGVHSDAEQSCTSDVPESVFSGRTGRSTTTELSWTSVDESTRSQAKIIQPLSSTSFITRSTEVTISPRDSVMGAEQIATVVHISATGPPQEVTNPGPEPDVPWGFPIPHLPPSNSGKCVSSPVLKKAESQPTGCASSTRGRQLEQWRPPDSWESVMEEPEQNRITPPKKPKSSSRGRRPRRQKSPQMELSHFQRSIRRMEAASPKIILERLKEEWMQVSDATIYRELEVEKQLWMLTALGALKKKKPIESIDQLEDLSPEASASTKILSLYENHASCSFLSAQSLNPTIHHLSTHPLSPKSYPNVHPLSVPGPTAQLPYASNIFTSIHAMSLPSILPASSIPSILKECYRTLTSASSPGPPTSPDSADATTSAPKSAMQGGTLHLTILDPSPVSDTLGPILRAWLDTHLILNLEKQFRCINPGRLFPIWLATSGLRAEGSTIISVKFLACLEEVKDSEVSRNENEVVKTQLKSVVGRMLWKEIWGGFVEGDKWWWDDEDVVEECERMGTCWECSVIEAVKDG